MPPKPGPGGRGGGKTAAGAGKYQKKAQSPLARSLSPIRGKKEEEGKDMAVILEEQRNKARKVLTAFAEETLEGLQTGGIDLEMVVRESVEKAVQDILAWLATAVGQKAKTDEYNMKLGELKGCLERAVELTRLKREEPPLPLNIFEHDHIVTTDKDRQIESAIKNGNADELRRLLKFQRGRALLNNKDEEGWTSLHHVVAQGQPELVKIILDTGAEVNAQNHAGWTPSHLACSNGRVSCLPLLITAGAQLDILTQHPPDWTPLHFASANGELEAVELLIKAKCDTRAKAGGAWTPLHLAAMNGHTNVSIALMWGNKEDMTNGADNSLGLETWTGDCKPGGGRLVGDEMKYVNDTPVSGLIPALVASCHFELKTQSQITAAMLRVKDENTRRAMEKKKKKTSVSPLSTSSPLPKAGGSSITSKSGSRAGAAKSPPHSKSPTRDKAKSPPHSKSPRSKNI